MSKKIINLPRIAITAESDDNTSERKPHIEETHTDVEELVTENPKRINRRSRLKIKVANDGYVTDMEDLQLSEAEEDYKVPASPLPNGIFDLDAGVIEEIQKRDAKTISQGNFKRNELFKVDDFASGATDIEDYYTDNEIEEKKVSVVSVYEFDYSFREQVSERTTKSKRKRKRSKQIFMTTSDIDDEVSDVSCSGKSLTLPTVNTDALTDVEDFEVTEKTTNALLKEDLKEQEKTDVESLESNTDLKEKVRIDDDAIDGMYLEDDFSAIRCTNKIEGEVTNWKEVAKIGETEKSQFLEADNFLTDEEVLSDFESYERVPPSPTIKLSAEAVVCNRERSKEVAPTFLKPTVEDGGYHTEIEDFGAPLKPKRKPPTTDTENFELSDNEYEKSRAAKRKPLRRSVQNNVATDVEDFEVSDDEDVTFSRAETATPVNVHQQLDSMCSSKVHSEHMKKINLNTPEEQMYVKGGGVEEACTDFEDLSVSEVENKVCRKRLSVDLTEDKIVVTVQQMAGDMFLNWNNYTLKLGISSGEGKM